MFFLSGKRKMILEGKSEIQEGMVSKENGKHVGKQMLSV